MIVFLSCRNQFIGIIFVTTKANRQFSDLNLSDCHLEDLPIVFLSTWAQ